LRSLLIPFIVCVLTLGKLAAQEAPPLTTNKAILAKFLITSVDSLITIGRVEPADTLVLNLEVADPELLVFIHRKFSERLLQKGFDKLFGKKENSFKTAGFVLYYQLLNWQIQYQLISSGWLRRKWVRRNILLQQGITLQQGDTGEVIWSGELNYQFQDRIRPKDIVQIENAYLKFTKGEFLSDFRNLKKWAEFLFLLGVSATIVYLFFSIRSY